MAGTAKLSALATEDVETSIKILIVGNGSIGKSSMIRRFCKGQYCDTYNKTIGVDFLEKEIQVDEKGGVDGEGESHMVRLMMWDTAGQEEFDGVTKDYYKDANAVVLAFATNDRGSFETIKSWRSKVLAVCDDLCMVLVQNKIDLIHEAAVTNEEAEELARDLRLKFYRVSVKEDVNVEEVFQYLASAYLKKVKDRTAVAVANVLSK
ncbi:Ras- protein Rab-23, partial [Quaeritorhiza haematococci]